MRLGIFAKTFERARFEDVLDAVASHGLTCVQFNFSCVGLPTLPESIDPRVVAGIREKFDGGASSASPTSGEQSRPRRDRPPIAIAGISGTFNMIDPDERKRRDFMNRLPVLAQATRALGCELISLCTGTRDPQDMWRAHPENNSPQAWRDLLRGMETAVRVAEEHDVVLGVEPEVGNVVSGVRKARQLLDELQSPRVKIILDPANLFHRGAVVRIRETMEEAFQLLGTDIVMAHAKELAPDGSVGTLPPGRGILDWNYYLDTLARMNFSGALVMHGLAEKDIGGAARFLRSRFCD
jgi:sugar phosphate isomerase/epimerase